MLKTHVVAVDVGAKNVTTDDGVVFRYDKLLVCTGSMPRRLPIPGGDLPNIFVVRTNEVSELGAGTLRFLPSDY
jgi:NAD(P)H-nitrite reductase large subunit